MDTSSPSLQATVEELEKKVRMEAREDLKVAAVLRVAPISVYSNATGTNTQADTHG